MNDQFKKCDYRTLTQQIGAKVILAISGGRVLARKTGITLPVNYHYGIRNACGYSVTIDLNPNDTYTIRRIYTRAGKETIKGEIRFAGFCSLSRYAYQASSFRSYPFPKQTNQQEVA